MTAKPTDIKSLADVKALLDRYFDGSSTLDDEDWLRSLLGGRNLPDIPLDGATAIALREALATISFSMAIPRRPIARRRVSPWVGAAASVIAVVTLTVTLLTVAPLDARANRCEAWVNGERVSDSDRVVALMHGQLDAFDDASDAALPAFGDFRDSMSD